MITITPDDTLRLVLARFLLDFGQGVLSFRDLVDTDWYRWAGGLLHTHEGTLSYLAHHGWMEETYLEPSIRTQLSPKALAFIRGDEDE